MSMNKSSFIHVTIGLAKLLPMKKDILQCWLIIPTSLSPSMKLSLPSLFSLEHWSPPPHGFLNFNFDGTSKGNPSLSSFSGVIGIAKDHSFTPSSMLMGYKTTPLLEATNLTIFLKDNQILKDNKKESTA